MLTPPDLLRLLGVALFFFVLAQALVINYAVARLGRDGGARPPALLAWHIHVVTIYSLGMHAVLAYVHARRLGAVDVIEWHLYLLLFLGALGNIAMYLIARVTAARGRIAGKVRR